MIQNSLAALVGFGNTYLSLNVTYTYVKGSTVIVKVSVEADCDSRLEARRQPSQIVRVAFELRAVAPESGLTRMFTGWSFDSLCFSPSRACRSGVP